MGSKNRALQFLIGLVMSFCIAVGWFISTSTAADIYSAVIISICSALTLYSIFIIIIFAIDAIIQTVRKGNDDK